MTTVNLSLKLPERIYHTSLAISILLRYETYQDYICDLIQRDITAIRDGADTLTSAIKKEKDELFERFD